MESKRFFFIIGMPRTRSAWLSVLLTGSESFCFHEGINGHATFASYATALRARPEARVGDSNPALAYYIDELLEHFPDARFVVVRRDPTTAMHSLAAAKPEDAEGIAAGWPCYLELFERAVHRLPECLEVGFEELQQEAACERIAQWLLGRPLEQGRWEQLRNLRIATTFPPVITRPPIQGEGEKLLGGSDAVAESGTAGSAGAEEGGAMRWHDTALDCMGEGGGRRENLSCVGRVSLHPPQTATIQSGVMPPHSILSPALSPSPFDFTALTVRAYTPADRPLVEAWWLAHRDSAMGALALPPLGVIVEDASGPAGALWCFETYGTGVAWIEVPVTRPGLSLREASAVVAFAVTALVDLAGKSYEPPADFTRFRVSCPPPMARVLKRLGFLETPPRANLLLTI